MLRPLWSRTSTVAVRICRRAERRRAVLPIAVPLPNINPEAAVMMMMMMVVMMMVVVTMQVTRWNNAVIAMMVVVVMVMMILRDLFSTLRLCRGDPRVIYLQRIQCIRNRLQEVAITGR